jgi:hypothetical protein
MSLSQAILPQSNTELMTSVLTTASLTLHQPYWLAPHLLRTNHCSHLSLYKLRTEVLPAFFVDF